MTIGEYISKLIFDKDFKARIEFLKKVTLFLRDNGQGFGQAADHNAL